MVSLLLAILFWPVISLAGPEIVDRSEVFPRLVTELGNNEFSQFLHYCPKISEFHRKVENCSYKCTSAPGYCESVCSEFPSVVKTDLVVGRCEQNSLVILLDELHVPLSHEDYIKGGHSWVYAFLSQIGTFIQPDPIRVIVRYSPFRPRVNRIVEGERVPLSVVTLEVEIIFGEDLASEQMYLFLSPEFRGAEQLVYFGSLRDFFFKKKGVIVQWK